MRWLSLRTASLRSAENSSDVGSTRSPKPAIAAIKTGIGQTNKLSVRTEGILITAFINDVQVATLAGEPPQGVSYIGLYGESAETTQNVWEFTDVTVTSVH